MVIHVSRMRTLNLAVAGLHQRSPNRVRGQLFWHPGPFRLALSHTRCFKLQVPDRQPLAVTSTTLRTSDSRCSASTSTSSPNQNQTTIIRLITHPLKVTEYARNASRVQSGSVNHSQTAHNTIGPVRVRPNQSARSSQVRKSMGKRVTRTTWLPRRVLL
jgi:hypothetical protein